MNWLNRAFRAFGRKVICTCANPDTCPAFGKQSRPIRLPADLNATITPEARARINALPDATLTVRLNCPPDEHQLIEVTNFGQQHPHYLCAICSRMTVCLHDPITTGSLANGLDCQRCITEAEETAQP